MYEPQRSYPGTEVDVSTSPEGIEIASHSGAAADPYLVVLITGTPAQRLEQIRAYRQAFAEAEAVAEDAAAFPRRRKAVA